MHRKETDVHQPDCRRRDPASFPLVPNHVGPQGLMGISGGLFLFAVGAILRFAVSTHVDGIDLGVIGVILMIVGVVAAIASALFWSSFSPYDRRQPRVVVHERDVI
jgi:uncharacterized protein DUF6458